MVYIIILYAKYNTIMKLSIFLPHDKIKINYVISCVKYNIIIKYQLLIFCQIIKKLIKIIYYKY